VHFLEDDFIEYAQKRKAGEAFISPGPQSCTREAHLVLWQCTFDLLNARLFCTATEPASKEASGQEYIANSDTIMDLLIGSVRITIAVHVTLRDVIKYVASSQMNLLSVRNDIMYTDSGTAMSGHSGLTWS
jgi:hypothetical protein